MRGPTYAINKMACVGTWSFSEQALREVAELVVGGSDCVSALEAGINGLFTRLLTSRPVRSVAFFKLQL